MTRVEKWNISFLLKLTGIVVLADGIQFDVIYAQSDSMAIGARMALKHVGINLKK